MGFKGLLLVVLCLLSPTSPLTHADITTTEGKIMKVIVNFNVKESSLRSFRGIMRDVKTNLPNVDGCEEVVIYEDLNDPHRFTLVESWSSREAHQSHVNHLIESGAWAKIVADLRTDPVSSYFSQL